MCTLNNGFSRLRRKHEQQHHHANGCARIMTKKGTVPARQPAACARTRENPGQASSALLSEDMEDIVFIVQFSVQNPNIARQPVHNNSSESQKLAQSRLRGAHVQTLSRRQESSAAMVGLQQPRVTSIKQVEAR